MQTSKNINNDVSMNPAITKTFVNTCELVEFLDKGICVYRALSVTSSAKKSTTVWFDVTVLNNNSNNVVCQSRALVVPMKYQKRKHFHS